MNSFRTTVNEDMDGKVRLLELLTVQVTVEHFQCFVHFGSDGFLLNDRGGQVSGRIGVRGSRFDGLSLLVA